MNSLVDVHKNGILTQKTRTFGTESELPYGSYNQHQQGDSWPRLHPISRLRVAWPGRGGVEVQKPLAVDEFPDGNDLVCIIRPCTKLEEINAFKLKRP